MDYHTCHTMELSVKPYQLLISTNMCIGKVHKRGRRSTIPTKTTLLCMVVQLLKFSLIYQKSAKFWVSIPTKKSSCIWRVKFGMHPHTHIPWTETLILAAAGRQNSHNQSTWNTCRQANTASLQIKNHQWEEGGERERELVTT